MMRIDGKLTDRLAQLNKLSEKVNRIEDYLLDVSYHRKEFIPQQTEREPAP